jgi:hypothetical protein
MGSQRGTTRRAPGTAHWTRWRDSTFGHDQRTGAQAPCRLRRPAAGKESRAKGQQADPVPPSGGSTTWCVCQWPNVGACKARFALQGRSVPTAEPSWVHKPINKNRMTVTTMTIDDRTTDAMARPDEIVIKRCPTGEPRAPDVKRYGEAQFRCICGHRGTLPYPELYKLLRRRKPMRLRCQRCGRFLR